MPIVEGLTINDQCIICERKFTDDDIRADDVEVISKEPAFPFGRFIKGGLRLFHKGTAYHCSCYYERKYRLN